MHNRVLVDSLTQLPWPKIQTVILLGTAEKHHVGSDAEVDADADGEQGEGYRKVTKGWDSLGVMMMGVVVPKFLRGRVVHRRCCVARMPPRIFSLWTTMQHAVYCMSGRLARRPNSECKLLTYLFLLVAMAGLPPPLPCLSLHLFPGLSLGLV